MNFQKLYDWHKDIKKMPSTHSNRQSLYEWFVMERDYGRADPYAMINYLFNYRENYEFLLNNFGHTLHIKDVPNKGNYKLIYPREYADIMHYPTLEGDGVNTFNISIGLNFTHDKTMYDDDGVWDVRSKFIISLRKLFKENTNFVTENFISIPPLLNLPGLRHKGNIIPLNFFRQGLQFDYMVNKIYSKYECNTILEIGGGLGNMAHFQKKYNKNCKCILLDIPLTLLFQYSFLTKLGYDVKLLKESELVNINTIIKNGNFDVLLILPHHLSKVNSNSIDLTLIFDSLSEFNPSTIIHYLDNIIRISKYFYQVNHPLPPWVKERINQPIEANTHSILDDGRQVYGNGIYFNWIALSNEYYYFLLENHKYHEN